MVSFGGIQKPPAYLSRREQKRLLLLGCMLALVIFSMFEAAKPKNWYWLWGGAPPTSETGELSEVQQTDIDTSLRLEDIRRPAPGVLVSPVPVAMPEEASTDHKSRHFAGVRPELLKTVRDAAPFRSDGAEAWNNLLDVLLNNDTAALEAASLGPVTMAQLYHQPNVYRGELITVRGVVRRVNRKELAKKKPGIDAYYQIWFQPNDNQLSPMVIYALELPREFPTGDDLREETQITGFFFKLWAYQAQDKIRTAPLILTRTFRWTKPEASPAKHWSVGQMLGVVAIATLIAAIAIALFYFTAKFPGKAYPGTRFSGDSPKQVTDLDKLEIGPVIGFGDWAAKSCDSPTARLDESS